MSMFSFLKGSSWAEWRSRVELWAMLVGGLVVSVLLWSAFSEREEAQVRYSFELEAKRAAEKLETQMAERTGALERLAERWDIFGKPSADQFRRETAALYRYFGGFQAIEWVDPDNRVQWVEPEAGNEERLKSNLALDPRTQLALEAIRRQGKVASTLVVPLPGKKLGYVAFIPVQSKGKFEGFIAGVFLLRETLATALNSQFVSQFAVSVIDPLGGPKTFVHHPVEQVAGEEWTQKLSVSLRGMTWHLQMQPTEAAIGKVRSLVPEVALLAGVCVTALLVAALRLAQRARQGERDLAGAYAFQRAIVESSEYGIISTDTEGIIRGFNPAAERMLGYRAGDVIGQLTPVGLHDIEELYRCAEDLAQKDGFNESIDTVVARLLWGGAEEREWTYIRIDGRRVPVLLSVAALKDDQGHLMGSVTIAADITVRKEAQNALIRAKEAAEDATRAKSDFLARMSHEIRTPMGGVIGMAELALQTSLTPEQRDYVETARASARSLLGIVNDILDFSKVEAGQLQLETLSFRLRDTLGDALKSLAFRAHAKGLELLLNVSSQVPEIVKGDPQRLRQVVVNLVDNALKFTEVGEVVLQVDVEQRSSADTALRFTIIDTGPGIPADKQAKIFEAFAQADETTSRKHGGTGLGLAICAQLAGLMGGRIWIESELGKGSRFIFTARFALAEAGEPESHLSLLPNLTGLRVLVAVESQTHSQILVELLSNWRMHPRPLLSGQSVSQALEAGVKEDAPIQLVLADGALGLDALHVAQMEPASLSWVMLTASNQREELIPLPPGARVARLAKPIIPSLLLETIQAISEGSPMPEAHRTLDLKGVLHIPRQRVLVADDNAVNRKVVTTLLEKAGHEVIAVEDGQAAVNALASRRFDMVFMDVQMPEMDGLEATRVIRGEEARRGSGRIPVIALTAQAMKGDQERCLEAGMDGYLTKPIDPAALLQALSHTQAAQAQVAASQEKSPPAAQPPVLDPVRLLAQMGDDEGLLKEVLELFLADLPQMREDLNHAVEAADAVALERAAHKLKGSLANLAADPASRQAFELEALGRAGTVEGAQEVARLLDLELTRLESTLHEMTRSRKAS